MTDTTEAASPNQFSDRGPSQNEDTKVNTNDEKPQVIENQGSSGVTYGIDLWDQLPVIKESTDLRVKQM